MEGRVPQKQINAFPRIETLRLSLFRADLLVTHTLYSNSEISDKLKNQCCSVNGIITKHFWTIKINKYHSMGEGELCTNLERLTNAVTRSESLQGKECNHEWNHERMCRWASKHELQPCAWGWREVVEKLNSVFYPTNVKEMSVLIALANMGGKLDINFKELKGKIHVSVNFK